MKRSGAPADHLKDLCLEAIRGVASDLLITDPFDSWLVSHGDETWVYVNDRPRENVAEGDVYTTFVIRLDQNQAILGVTQYRSRKGATADETLPP